jgi:hypothetical protein
VLPTSREVPKWGWQAGEVRLIGHQEHDEEPRPIRAPEPPGTERVPGGSAKGPVPVHDQRDAVTVGLLVSVAAAWRAATGRGLPPYLCALVRRVSAAA